MEILDEALFESRPLDKSSDDVSHYVIREGGIEEMNKILKRKIIRTAVSMAILVFSAIGIFRYIQDEVFDVEFYLIYAVILAIAFPILIYRSIKKGLKKNKEIYSNYELFVSSDAITREISAYPSVTISVNEIKDILLQKNGSIVIRSKSSTHDLIGIPVQIERYDELERKLSNIMPFTKNFNFFKFKVYQALFTIGLIGSLFCVYFTENKIVLGFNVISLLALGIWSFISVSKSKNLAKSTVRSNYISLLLPLFAVLLAIYKIAQ